MKLKTAKIIDAREMLFTREGVYFDFDGVLVNPTDGIFRDAYYQVLERYGIRPSVLLPAYGLAAFCRAKNAKGFWPTLVHGLNEANGIGPEDHDEVMEMMIRFAEPKLRAVRLKPGVAQLLGQLKDNGQQLGLVTQAMESTVEAVASVNPEIERAFEDRIITGDDLGPKEVAYWNMLYEMGHDATDVAFIEDTKGGARSARKAGIPKENGVGVINGGLLKEFVKDCCGLSVMKHTKYHVRSLEELV